MKEVKNKKTLDTPHMSHSDCGHDQEHALWSRRQFMMTGGMASLGGMMLGKLPLQLDFSNPIANTMLSNGSDNILVFVKLFGGNDGLNTIVPYSDKAGVGKYYDLRPTLGLKHGTDYTDNQLLSGYGDVDYALPGSMDALMPLWHDGKMKYCA